jgi:hypothetical protein
VRAPEPTPDNGATQPAYTGRAAVQPIPQSPPTPVTATGVSLASPASPGAETIDDGLDDTGDDRSAPTWTDSPRGAVAAPAAEPTSTPAGVDHHAPPQTRADPLLMIAGQLAILGAAASVVGLFQAYQYTASLWQGRSDVAHMRWYALYLLTMAVPILGAGAGTLIPATRRLIGPGLLLGITAASTWSLVYLASDRLNSKDAPGMFGGDGWWVELVAHLVLVLAACLAGLALVRTAQVHLVRRPPRSKVAWLVALLGVAGALALLFHDRSLWNPTWPPNRWYAAPSIWMTIMAAVVPACAAVAVPRRFGVGLLAGWIAGGAGFFGFHYTWDRYQESGNIGRTPIITFGFTLLALLIATVLFARTKSSAQVQHTTQG